MRTERDFLGEVSIDENALYGIHALRAKSNFPGDERFSREWYMALGEVKLACYNTLDKFIGAAGKKYPGVTDHLKLPSGEVINALSVAAGEISEGEHFEHFIVPALQGGAGTSINMNINEIIANRALVLLGKRPGEYAGVDPIETANIYQSTNDIVPTSLRVALMRLFGRLEREVNDTRSELEKLETRYRSALRLAYTQMQEAVPSTYGMLFSAYSDALSRDWWRISKAFERIKQVNLGGGATGTGLSIPRYFIMEAVNELRKGTGLPLARAENMVDITSNQDQFVEVHAIMKSHAVNLEKIAGDLRLLSSRISGEPELFLPERQAGSSIMPGKVNPVIPEFIISGTHRVYSNDQLITSLSGQGTLELNAYLPSIGHHLIDSLCTLVHLNRAFREYLLRDLKVDTQTAEKKLFHSPAITTALSPLLGYHRAAELAKFMRTNHTDVFTANEKLRLLPKAELKRILTPSHLLKAGFSLQDIEDFKKGTGE